ncbi:hypothetical protein Cgig2_025225 [Carnegiea gigantea]|uniref:Pectinesterase n=1 Tax=Carnegiea gigantea TaxID=171969 RepID=A0A9Q1KPD3_9CARY|nr:hypothetical protein Cgig2_025225 [Carnegiea gigantea]
MKLPRKQKKLLLALLSSLLLIATTIAIAIGIKSHHGDNDRVKLSPATHTILKSSCSSTRYPDLCYDAVASAPSHMVQKISTQKDVIELSLNLTTITVEHNFFTVEKIIKTRSQNLTPRERNALHDCLETIDDTLDDLRQAIQDVASYPSNNDNSNNNNNNNKKINPSYKSLKNYADDIKTLISSAITNQETCLDGFSHDDADRHVRAALERGQVHVEKMCSNALAMIKNLTDADIIAATGLVGKDDHVTKRRLYDASGWPQWMSSGDRRMLQQGPSKPDAVVAADGSGDHRTINEAVEAAPTKSKKRYVILIKAGVHTENVVVHKHKQNLMFVGEGRSKTIITGSKNVVDNSTTYDSATVAIMGEGFLARDLTFQNTAGPSKHQAVALRVGADHSAFYQCDILAYQDTLYVHHSRQFFINCLIAGTIDFIFGNAAVVIQDCDIHARMPNPNQKNMVTAQSRSDPNQNTGIVIQKSRIGATMDLQATKGSFETYLGRPWKAFSRTVIMQSTISDVVHPKGWHEWDGNFGLHTLYYAEYKNTGLGASTSGRVQWKGVKVISGPTEARQFSPREFIDGDNWLPSTSFPYSLDL